MKYIIDTYGRFLLNGAIVTLALVLILSNIQDADGNKGVFKMIKANLNVEGAGNAVRVDFDKYRDESGKEPPVIMYDDSLKIYAGEDIQVTDFIKAYDFNNNPLELRILKVTDSANQDVTSCFDQDSGSINFPSEGIYRIEAAAEDSSNRKYTCAVKIPVNKSDGGLT